MENPHKSVLEGIIFVFGEEGVTLEQLSIAIDYPKDLTKILLDELVAHFHHDQRGMELVVFGDTYKFITKPFIRPYIERILTLTKTRQLSQSALETLAIIAYKQPVTRIEIEEIRGVSCDLMLRKLMAMDLIHDVGRADSVGKPILYSVTSNFLEVFKLMSLDELPKLPNYQDSSEESQLFE
jgi:segregation and condensation protein B